MKYFHSEVINAVVSSTALIQNKLCWPTRSYQPQLTVCGVENTEQVAVVMFVVNIDDLCEISGAALTILFTV